MPGRKSSYRQLIPTPSQDTSSKKYDYDFMDYIVRVLLKCKQYGFRVYMDPHQDTVRLAQSSALTPFLKPSLLCSGPGSPVVQEHPSGHYQHAALIPTTSPQPRPHSFIPNGPSPTPPIQQHSPP